MSSMPWRINAVLLHILKASLLASILVLRGGGAVAVYAEEMETIPIPLIPGATWYMDTDKGLMHVSGLTNNYGEKIVLPYEDLSYTRANLTVSIKKAFDTRVSVTLGFVTRPIDMAWTSGASFFKDANASELDVRLMPYLLLDIKVKLRPYAGYNYQNYLLNRQNSLGKTMDEAQLTRLKSYYGYHSISFGLDFTTYPLKWLRLNLYMGIAPFMLCDTIMVDPYLSYGGSLYLYFWRLRIGLIHTSKRSPKWLSLSNTYSFKTDEQGISIWMRL